MIAGFQRRPHPRVADSLVSDGSLCASLSAQTPMSATSRTRARASLPVACTGDVLIGWMTLLRPGGKTADQPGDVEAAD